MKPHISVILSCVIVAAFTLLLVSLENRRQKVAVDLGSGHSDNLVVDATFDAPAGELTDVELSKQLAATAPDLDTLREQLTARRTELLHLMESDPQAAWASRLSLAEYAAIPEELRDLVETPFAESVDYSLLPICGSGEGVVPAQDSFAMIQLKGDDVSLELKIYGHQASIGSKSALSVYGFHLDGMAVIDTRRAVPLENLAEVAAAEAVLGARRLDIQGTDPQNGAQLDVAKLSYALVGQTIVAFNSQDSIAQFNQKIDELDRMPGPNSPSLEAFIIENVSEQNDLIQASASPYQADGTNEDNLVFDVVTAYTAAVQAASSDWTETPKSVFFIRVDFSDVVGEPIAQATLESRLNLDVSELIRDMSYGKTWLVAEVSSMVVRMPNPASTYAPSNNGPLHDDAKTAFNAEGTGIDLDSYDIIGVYFASIGMQGSGITYGGLAGGGRQWLQNSYGTSLVTHEFGHNYGIGHASFWNASKDVGDGTVVGAGASEEYGDDYDIMGNGGSPEGHFHPQAKALVNWLETDEWVDATLAGSGVYRIHQFDHADTDSTTVRGLRIDKGTDEYYWLGLRQNYPSLRAFDQGAYMVWELPGYNRSWLTDTTPGSVDGKEDAPIELGLSYVDTIADIVITPVAEGGVSPDAYIDIAVQVGIPASNSAPTGSIAGPASMSVRQAAAFQVATNDPDGDTVYTVWDFGDGEALADGNEVAYSFRTGGNKTIKARLNDTKGGYTEVSHSITVDDPAATWNSRTSDTSKSFRDICIGDNSDDDPIALAISYGSFRTSASISTDGETWTTTEIPLTNANMKAVTYTGTHFIAVGQDYDFDIPSWVGSIIVSTDGVNWTQPVQLTFASSGFEGVATNGSTHVAVGVNGLIYYSTDSAASVWTATSNPATENLYSVTYGNGIFLAVGGASNGSTVQVLASSDGINWVDQSSGAGVASWQNFYDVEYLNDRFLASGWYSNLRTSTDQGQSFSTNLSDRYLIPAMAYGRGLFFAAGVNQDASDEPTDLYSTDGVNWTVGVPPGTQSRAASVFFNNSFITVGANGTIWQSATISEPGEDWATYQADVFSGENTNIGFGEDFDGDGIANGVEFAKGTDPKLSNSMTDLISIDGASYPTYNIQLSPTIDVGALVEVSNNLVDWSAAGIVEVSRSSTEWVVRSSNITTDEPKQFFRVSYLQAE